MRRRFLNLGSVLRLSTLGMVLLFLASLSSAFAAANTVYESGADEDSFPITANSLKPPQCASINLTNIVVGSGVLFGSNGNDLMLGSGGFDFALGRQGADCILGGGGGDNLWGNGGDDMILGGLGDDSLRGGGGNDVCDGGPGNDSAHRSCESTPGVP